jgi:hypothetical protein
MMHINFTHSTQKAFSSMYRSLHLLFVDRSSLDGEGTVISSTFLQLKETLELERSSQLAYRSVM